MEYSHCCQVHLTQPSTKHAVSHSNCLTDSLISNTFFYRLLTSIRKHSLCFILTRLTTMATPLILEFLEHVHNIFQKPWEQYNAHFHLDNTVCDGKISSSEWEAGGYFEAEFVVDGRIVLFAHFEEVETRTRKLDTEEAKNGESWKWGWQGSTGHEDAV
ncbi:hypothetical protein HBH56_126870 [Parastagonospora nodorum]|nr:hypothetical protein HBH56_126870 [Parastagonospora nodorum]KAH3947285.1 hypothetical protein HBH53_117130 [Parastagonospora nodorum]KAH3970759.1 hypothetical protein HBH51_113580 [Parastagonospora nodorum]KAH3971492.1 hypothetical protein HBH52_155850 [Parastagonospora nodorum]KAH3996410.1 hypothetical protein HBI10_154950 [Parastagonospora nodorum]